MTIFRSRPMSLAQALHPAHKSAFGLCDVGSEESGRQVTGLLGAFATIDKLQATIEQRDQSVVALVVENSKLRRQVEQLAGELAETRAALAWQVKR